MVTPAQQSEVKRPVIVDPQHATDSRGETIYKLQSDAEKAETIVPGVLAPPAIVKSREPKIPRSFRKTRGSAVVVVKCVVALNGDVMDLQVDPSTNSDLAQAALEAVAHYHARPAKLDGSPVAVAISVEISFRVF